MSTTDNDNQSITIVLKVAKRPINKKPPRYIEAEVSSVVPLVLLQKAVTHRVLTYTPHITVGPVLAYLKQFKSL